MKPEPQEVSSDLCYYVKPVDDYLDKTDLLFCSSTSAQHI